MKIRLSLRNILTLNFLVAALLPLFAVGIISLHFISNSLEKEIANRNFLLAQALSGEVERFLSEPSLLLGQIEDYIEKKLIKEEDINIFLQSLVDNYGFFRMIKILDDKGMVRYMAPLRDDYLGFDMSRQPFFIKSKETGAHFWSPTFISIETGHSTLALAKPLKQGVVVGDLDIDVLHRIIDRVKLGSNGYAAIVDKDGVTIAHPNRTFVSERLNVKNLNVIAEGLSGKEGTFRYVFRDEEKIGSVATVPQTGWLVVVIQPVDEAFAPVQRIRNTLKAGAALAALFAIVLSIISVQRALRPFSRLLTNVRKVADGDYRINHQPKSYEEIDRLTDDFLAMAKAIEIRENAIKKSEERLMAIFEASPDPMIVYDINGLVVNCNSAFVRVFGWSLEEVKGKRIDYVPEDEKEMTQARIRELYETTEPCVGFETKRFTKDGKTLDILLSSSLIKDEEKNPVGIVVSLKDITELKSLEARFRAVQRMESIGTLAGGIAHDFNNLLMSIQGNASLILLDVDRNHPHHERLMNIEKHVKQGANLTRQLLGFARGGKYEVKPTNLNELIKSHNLMFGRTKKEIRIDEKFEKNVWTATVDRGQIEQVLMNLYLNASQAMPDGGSIYIRTDNVVIDEEYNKAWQIIPGKYVRISVTDTGHGIDESIREKIFEPFFTTKERGARGTGLGLSSVYGIIKNHDGFINVYSEKGKGATFTIYLPATESEVTGELKIEQTLKRGNAIILLVDDEPVILDVGKDMLEALGYRVMTAGSGKEALETYRTNKDKIDIVILDMIMPEIGGGKTFDMLKDVNPLIKVILSSGYSINGHAQEIMDRGCNGFMQKPFSLRELSVKLKDVLHSP